METPVSLNCSYLRQAFVFEVVKRTVARVWALHLKRRRKYGGHFVTYFFTWIVTCRQQKTRQDNLGNEIIRTLTSTDNWSTSFGMLLKDKIYRSSCRIFEYLRHIHGPWAWQLKLNGHWIFCFLLFILV